MYPNINEIEIRWRSSASRFCIIVEGQREEDDAWFYNQWFGDRATTFTFFPQNGWSQVVTAVEQLRPVLGANNVFGIVDRDFRDSPNYNEIPLDGILWTPKYTLENYLLNPECWYEVVHPFTLRTPKPGWNSVEEAEQTIHALYQKCIPLAAYNATLNYLHEEHSHAFEKLSESQQKFKEHPKALKNLGDLSTHFQTLAGVIGLSIDLESKYEKNTAELHVMNQADLEQNVSGKYVLALLKETYPMGSPTKRAWDDILGGYIKYCPEPPGDLVRLMDLIRNSA